MSWEEIYLWGCVVMFIPISMVFVWDMGGPGLGIADVFLALLIGICVVWFWPLFLVAIPLWLAFR